MRKAARRCGAVASTAFRWRHRFLVAHFPDALKGSGVVRVCSSGGALQAAQREAYFKPFEALSGIKVIEAQGPDTSKVKVKVRASLRQGTDRAATTG